MVEIIPKPKEKIPTWQIVLFYFSILLLVGALLTLFLLENLQKDLSRTLENLKASLTREKTPEEKALEEGVFKSKDKINNFAFLFENRKINSNLFPLLEKICHPKVMFTDFNLDSWGRKLTLLGRTKNFQSLGQQISIFKQEEQIIRVDLFNISIAKEGEIRFEVTLLISPEVFKF